MQRENGPQGLKINTVSSAGTTTTVVPTDTCCKRQLLLDAAF